MQMEKQKQQQILGYFIEEAKEHLETLESGLLDLRSTVADSERLNELFRAAHSIKGGAAMLGFTSIHKIGHRLEDSFKLLQEHPLTVDQQLESFFLKGFDALKELVDCLQGPFGLRDEDADQILQESEPAFSELQDYLNRLIGVDIKSTVAAAQSAKPKASAQPQAQSANSANNLTAQVTVGLKQMLQLFKQKESAASRQQLQALCARLLQLGKGVNAWQNLVKTAQAAIANPKNSYQVLAPLVIKELKEASALVQTGRADEVAPSQQLRRLAAVPEPVRYIPESTAPAMFMEPRLTAKALIQAFNKQQLTEIAELLLKAAK
ncbi:MULTISPECIES: Hpt domain-containing protein [Trichocoleus]|uniref:Hpt domain-containing protein n=1 Tax=Trichocoleus desertorum GB2-A4 TaxID=2933944 RepID=A0ABV0J4P3_9CYAN|nr:Hpt domain-containing protein [Trichocoleus sp. FACHB-46]